MTDSPGTPIFPARDTRFTPETVAERGFAQVKRGYAESEVRAFLRMVSDEIMTMLARERDYARREVLLHRIQQITIDRVMFAPIMDYRTLRGVGPRVAEHMLDSQHLIPFPAYEDVRLKSQ